jgi:hypothetical protein
MVGVRFRLRVKVRLGLGLGLGLKLGCENRHVSIKSMCTKGLGGFCTVCAATQALVSTLHPSETRVCFGQKNDNKVTQGQDKSQAHLRYLLHCQHLFPNTAHPTNTCTTSLPRHMPLFQRRLRSNKGMSQHKNTAKVKWIRTKSRHGSQLLPSREDSI